MCLCICICLDISIGINIVICICIRIGTVIFKEYINNALSITIKQYL